VTARLSLLRRSDDCFGSFSTELGCLPHVRSFPDSERIADIAGGPVRARNRPLPSISLMSDSHSDHSISNLNHCLALTCLARV
jgi:hypothetical protein